MIDKVFSIDINAPVDRVWQEITRRESPHAAMFSTYLRGPLEPGAVFTYQSRGGNHTFVLGKIIEVHPPNKLVHTFRFSMEKDDPTLVEWTLTQLGDDATRVTVHHSRFDGQTRTYKSVETSWPTILGIYKQLIETGRAPLSVRVKNGLMMSMTFMLPKSAKTQNAINLDLDVK